MARRVFVDADGRLLYAGEPTQDKVDRLRAIAGAVELDAAAGEPPDGHLFRDGAWVPAPPPPPPTAEQKQSAAIDRNVSLASFTEIIAELAGVIPIQQAPKLHAMKDQIAAIKDAAIAAAVKA